MDPSRPRIVLDCCKLRQLDKPTIYLLLCSLEEAVKRNGDIKLGAIPAGGSAIFDLPGLDGLFEDFDTISGAIDSFQRLPLDGILPKDAFGSSPNNPAN
jgi:anti-sigma B factor antagonist